MKSKRALDISALPPIENLKIGSFGYRCPEPLFKYGPVIHKGYYLCYILEGKGCFQYGSHYYSLSKGQGFLIEPDVIISCQAEKISPWEYAWLELRGPMVRQLLYSMKLSSANPVFHCKQNSHLKYYT
ncbi:AraC family ligand binding domain-containing protein [[Clostridium] symbiosum]